MFEDDLEINKFLETIEEFSEMHIDQDSVPKEGFNGGKLLSKIAKHDIIQLHSNHIARGLVPLERLFNGNDVEVKGRLLDEDVDTAECNIGTPEEPKFVKLSSSLTQE